MSSSSTSRFNAAARLGFLVLLVSSGCADSDLADGEFTLKAGLDAPPIAVGAFLDGVFPVRTPNSAGSATWSIAPAFPALDLGDTLVISPNPINDKLYVGTRDGLVRMFDNDPAVASYEEFIDLTDRAWAIWDGGFLGLIFHPEFGQPGSPFRNYFYVYYSSHCQVGARPDGQGLETDLATCDTSVPQSSTSGFFGAYLRLSRFEVPDGSTVGDPSSEKVMINMRLYNGSHRGGGMVFRNDGYLYVTIGDQFRYETAQDIVNNLEGGTHRFAVDIANESGNSWSCPPGSHLPRRIYDTADEISGQFYCIPDDNPWLDVGGGNFEEYCSLGHRNPHRLAWDPVTDYMWSGEIGQSTREEINVIFCGNNYGWPFREGLVAGVRPEPASYEGILTDPVIDFDRSEARAIIGGYVYRGARYPELYGRYLAGDYVLGNIWAITLDEGTMTATKEYLTEFTPGGLGTWGQDKNGETYLGDVIGGATLWELDRISQGIPDPPPLLSQLGAFDNLSDLTPSDVWVPYTLNQPFWSDAALKSRFIAVPNDGLRDTAGEQIGFAENDYWTFPIGTVLMKHFELGLDESDPSIKTRLETRFMVLGDDLIWYALTYRWLANQTDAVLLTTGETANYTIQLAEGGARNQTWSFPSRLECMDCHRQESGGVLGPRTHQLNGDYLYPSTGRTDNQLATWNELDMFAPALDPLAIPTMPRSRALADVTGSLEERARSWLDSNCSSCHHPGTGIAGFDARYWTPLASQSLVWGPVRDDLGSPGLAVITPEDPALSSVYLRMNAVGGIAMPPLAKALAEVPAVDLMGEWILRIDPGLPQAGVNYEYWETAPLSVLPNFDSLGPADEIGTVGTFDISVRNRDIDFAFRFTGYLEVSIGGDYTFYTSSDDGSKLYVDGTEIVDNDGLHADSEQSGGPITLTPGYYAIEVTMFERDGQESLSASWSGPDTGNTQQPMGVGDLYLTVPTPVVNDPPTLQAPADQASSAGAAVVLDLSANDNDGDFLYFDAASLPNGLSVDHVTGRISGTIPANEPAAAYVVTASVSDGPEVDFVSFNWTVAGSVCGDGVTEGGEECDDGNTANGDGCSAVCTIEIVELCGDGFVTASEQCDDGNTVDGDGCSAVCTIEIVELCGDGFVTASEQCDDGNTVDGDGCSALCQIELAGQDLTNLGAIIAAVPDAHGGTWDLEVIRDGDKPPVGNQDSSRQYDTWDGIDAATEDWIGYSYPSSYVFGKVVFQEGRNFYDGGWFDSLTVQVRQGGIWNDVSALSITPAYPGNNGVSFETFEMTFAPASGDAIRIYGAPGGSAGFVSIGELEVFAPAVQTVCGDGVVEGLEECDDGNTISADGCSGACFVEFCGDGIITPPEQCDDGNTANGDGCSAVCTIEIVELCGDGFVTASEQCDDGNTVDGDGCSAVCTIEIVELCGDGFVTASEQCDDGNTVDGDGCSALCQIELAGQDLTNLGAIIAAVPDAHGGTWDLEVIRDGDKPPVGNQDSSRQYDTWDGIDAATEDWIGYSYPSSYVFGKVVFQEGRNFYDGGWFDSLTVQVRQGGIWNDVSALSITPAYPGNNGVSFETFEMTFAPASGDAIRIYGAPGGSAGFVSIGELEVFAPAVQTVCGDGVVEGLEECDDGNTISADGCSGACFVEFCGDGIITPPEQCDDGNNSNGDGCDATCNNEPIPVCGDGVTEAGEECDDGNTANGDGCSAVCTIEIVELCGDGFVTASEQCDDGNTVDGDGCSALCQIELAGQDLTNLGAIIAAIPDAHGGTWDLEVIRDGDKPPVGNQDSSRQYDTWDGIDAATEDWIGYSYPSSYVFGRVVFQEGRNFFDGGWFDSLTVQVRQGGIWNDVSALSITPAYPGNNGVSFETFEMTFAPTSGDAIRIYGAPGGSAGFVSIGELEVFAAELP